MIMSVKGMAWRRGCFILCIILISYLIAVQQWQLQLQQQQSKETQTTRTATEEDDFSSVVGDMDLSSRLDCGGHKCFIPSKSNQDIGYLVERDVRNRMSHIDGAWDVAKWIDREFGEGLHLYIDAPFTVELNETMWKKVNNLVYRPNRRGKSKSDPKFYRRPTIAVQITRKAPNNTLFFGCFYINLMRYLKDKDAYFEKLNETGNITEFIKNSEESYNIVEKVFQAKSEFLFDFQALFDSEGRIFFIDLDGHLGFTHKQWAKYGNSNNTTECLRKIDQLREDLKRMVSTDM